MKHILSLIIFLSVSMMAVYAQPAQKPATIKDALVRVAIVRDAREVDIQVDGPFTMAEGKNSREFSSFLRLGKTKVRLLDKGFFISGDVYPYERLVLLPQSGAVIKVNQQAFRGQIVLLRTPGDRITVINTVNIEDYVKGVLYHEVSHHWPIEAIKAQAVATRTYALYSMSRVKDYDVTNDIYSQVYGGRGSERYRTGLAVERTVSQVLTFNSKILPAYFHACCGGMTEDVSALWDIHSQPLRGVPCAFCKDAPHMNWKNNMRLKTIQDLLNGKGHKIGLIKEINIIERDRSNRVKRLKFTGRAGEVIELNAEELRELLGPNTLRSNNYEIVMRGYYVDLIGHGWGHGVGMCQWGARGMALQQFTYLQILNYYYPGAMIVDYHDVR